MVQAVSIRNKRERADKVHHIYTLKISADLNNEEFQLLASLVTEEKRGKINKFKRAADAQRTLFGDVLSRYAICRNFNLRNHELVICENEHGKPFVKNRTDAYFNISHTGRYVACGVGDAPVGVDVEEIKPVDLKIAERFFNMNEYNYLLAQSEALRTERFFELWTMKESYIKLQGAGLSIPLNSFNVLDESGAWYYQFIKNSEVVGHICLPRRGAVSNGSATLTELLKWAHDQEALK